MVGYVVVRDMVKQQVWFTSFVCHGLGLGLWTLTDEDMYVHLLLIW